MMRQFALAILIFAVFMTGSASQSIVDEHHNPVLVSVCQIYGEPDAGNPRIVLGLVYEIGNRTATLYKLGRANVEPMAWMHYGSPTTDEFFEAQGGVLSTEITGKIFLCLTTRPFFLVESLSDIRVGDYDAEIGSCLKTSGDGS